MSLTFIAGFIRIKIAYWLKLYTKLILWQKRVVPECLLMATIGISIDAH